MRVFTSDDTGKKRTGAEAFLRTPAGAGNNEAVLKRTAMVVATVAMIALPLFASQADIRLNQIGFTANGPKTAVVVAPEAWYFSVRDPGGSKIYYTAELSAQKVWATSAETLKVADFSQFTREGEYVVWVEGKGASYPFTVKNSSYDDALRGLLKAFYYQRASTPLTSACAGRWARDAGHPDNEVSVHPSAASDPSKPGFRAAHQTFSSPKGWYDAGDYGKYTVNAGITTYELLLLYEQFPGYLKTLSLTIPESNNSLPDILDEIKWELDWLLTMQDPADGGVYHKITDKSFIGDLMPAAANEKRYFIGKGAAAAFDFAAVLAVAYRIYKPFLASYADSCLTAAKYAWEWGQLYPDSTFRNPADVVTGEYGDRRTGDEHLWAGCELFIATGDSAYYVAGESRSSNFVVPGWPDVALLGCYSLALQKNDSLSKRRILKVADELVNRIPSHPYRMCNVTGDYYWGSNAVVANQGVSMLVAYLLTSDITYLEGAVHAVDYLFGRNATGYCFVTGFGKKSPLYPHHRPSTADNIVPPVPGLLVGGPNPGSRDGESCTAPYPAPRAKAYFDNTCSFTTNEVAINWNAPAALLVGAVSALLQKDSVAIAQFNNRYVDRVAPGEPVVHVGEPGVDRVALTVKADEVVSVSAVLSTDSLFSEVKAYPSCEGDSCTVLLDGLKPGTRYYLKVHLIDAAGNVTTVKQDVSTAGVTADVAVFYRAPAGTLNPGVDNELSFDAPANMEADLLYGLGGEVLAAEVPFTRSGTRLVATIPATMSTDRGVAFRVRVRSGADTVTTPLQGLAAKTAVIMGSQRVVNSAYQLVSVPGRYAPVPSLTTFAGALGDTATWRYFGYTHGDGSYISFDSIRSGTGGWLYAEKSAAVSFTTDCHAPVEPVPVHLRRGWNCVGNPFTFPLLWDNTLVKIGDAQVGITDKAAGNFLRRQLFLYDDATPNARNDGTYRTNRNLVSHLYTDSTMLLPWSACWVYAEADDVVCLLSPDAQRRSVPLAKKRSLPQEEWLYEVHLVSGGVHEGPLVFGKAAGAKEGYDLFDTPKPPSPGALLKAGFEAVDQQGNSVVLTGVFSNISDHSGAGWELVVESATGMPLHMEWKRSGVAGEKVYLYDEATGQTVDMQEVHGCTLPAAAAGVRKLQFRQSVQIASVAAPAQWEFSAAAGRSVRFSYAVPQLSGKTCRVAIDIFDIRGRLVQRLMVMHTAPGRYSLRWNGVAQGRSTRAQGLYVARISTENYSKSISFNMVR